MNTTRRGAALLCLLAALATLPTGTQAGINIATTAHLGFGRFTASAGAGGSVTIAPNGTRSPGGGVILLSSPFAAASFMLSDRAGGDQQVIISLPANGSVLLRDGPRTMPLNQFTSNYPGGVMPGGRAQILAVGATLLVAPNQPPGNYSGNFHVTVNYQ